MIQPTMGLEMSIKSREMLNVVVVVIVVVLGVVIVVIVVIVVVPVVVLVVAVIVVVVVVIVNVVDIVVVIVVVIGGDGFASVVDNIPKQNIDTSRFTVNLQNFSISFRTCSQLF